MKYQFAVCDDRPEDSRLVSRLCAQWAAETGYQAAVLRAVVADGKLIFHGGASVSKRLHQFIIKKNLSQWFPRMVRL